MFVALVLYLLHQTLVNQGGERIKYSGDLVVSSLADSLGAFEGAATHKDLEPTEQSLFLLAQQVVAPLNGVAQRFLAYREVACATRQDIERAREALEQGHWRQ